MPPERRLKPLKRLAKSAVYEGSDSDSDHVQFGRPPKAPRLTQDDDGSLKGAMPCTPDFTEQFKSGAFSDCRVKCGDRVWNVHKLVLCSQSKFFEAALTGNFAEAKDGTVTLDGQNPDVVNNVLEYLYSGNLSHVDEKVKPPSSSRNNVSHWLSSLETYTDMYVLADFLGLLNIRKEILDELGKIIRDLDNAVRNNRGQCIGVDNSFSERFAACAKLAYSVPIPVRTLGAKYASIRVVFVEFLRAAGLRNMKTALEYLATSVPLVLVDIIILTK
ncbi:BTB/POZ fold [Naviculisporaceae sp. PSN 640]